MRLNKYLAQCGLGSRRKCDEIISKGKIKINGQIVKDFSFSVTNEDYVQYNNKLIDTETLVTYMLFKPKGYICTKNDKYNRKVIYDLLPSGNLFSVGRLDYDTTGLILLTNDGDLCYKLSHPKFQIKKKYIVSTDQKLTNSQVKQISKGLRIDNKIKYTATINFLSSEKNKFFWDVILTEGKNREIKKIFNFFGIKVLSLHRYKFGNLMLGALKEGKYRKIKKSELKSFEK